MSTHNICFCREIRKLPDTHSNLDLCLLSYFSLIGGAVIQTHARSESLLPFNSQILRIVSRHYFFSASLQWETTFIDRKYLKPF